MFYCVDINDNYGNRKKTIFIYNINMLAKAETKDNYLYQLLELEVDYE